MLRKATDKQLLEEYSKLGNVWKVAEVFDMCGQSVHERLHKLKAINDNHWTNDDDIKLINMYTFLDGDIRQIAHEMDRSYAAIACRANEIGITNQKRQKRDETKDKLSQLTHERWKTIPHPKGMLGKKHTAKTKEVISNKSKEMWNDPNSKLNSEDHKQTLSDRMMVVRSKISITNTYSRCKRGYYEIDGNMLFFRSSWEAKYAEYLVLLQKMKVISSWQYEYETFWFEKIKRGVRSYTPDFKLVYPDGTVEFHEVKGWMDDKSKTKIKRMAKYYPNVKLVVIDQVAFKTLKKQGWIK